jgi:RNA processing factor Prp31
MARAKNETMHEHIVHEMIANKTALDARIDAVETRVAEIDREYDRDIDYLKKRVEELVAELRQSKGYTDQ